jgi:hypothetical protein
VLHHLRWYWFTGVGNGEFQGAIVTDPAHDSDGAIDPDGKAMGAADGAR